MLALHTTRYGCAKCGRQLTVTAQHRQKTPHRHSYKFAPNGLCYPTPVIAVRLQTLSNAAVGTGAGSSDPALILLADVGASFNFDFNDYLHPLPYAWFPSLRNTCYFTSSDLLHSLAGNFFTSSVIIVYSVSGNSAEANRRLRARTTSKPWLQFLPLIYLLIDLLPLHCDKVGLGGLSCTLPGLAPEP